MRTGLTSKINGLHVGEVKIQSSTSGHITVDVTTGYFMGQNQAGRSVFNRPPLSSETQKLVKALLAAIESDLIGIVFSGQSTGREVVHEESEDLPSAEI